MANFTSNNQYGGGFYQPQFTQSSQPAAPYGMPPSHQYMQQARPPPFPHQAPQPGQHLQYPNSAAFAANNQYQPHNPSLPPPPPSQFYGYPQYSSGIGPSPYHPPHMPGPNGSIQIPPYSSLGPQANPLHVHTSQQQASPFLGNSPQNSRLINSFSMSNANPQPGLTERFAFYSTEPERDYVVPISVPSVLGKANLPGLISVNDSLNSSMPEKASPKPNQVSPLRSATSKVIPDAEPTVQIYGEEASDSMLAENPEGKSPQTPQRENPIIATEAVETLQENTPEKEVQKISSGPEKDTTVLFKRQWTEKRNQAKSALMQLDESNINYHQILDENLDKSLLSHLYTELGLNMFHPLPAVDIVLPLEQQLSGLPNAREAPSRTMDGERPSEIQEASLMSGPNHASSQRSDTSLEPGEVAESGNEPMQDASKEAQKDTGTVDEIAQPKDSSASLPKKPPIVDKALERKDYIARLLAAKKAVTKDGDNAPSTKTVRNAINTSITVESTPTEVTNRQLTLPQRPETAVAPAEVKKPEVKDPVQTELVRRRLEALKNSSKSRLPLSAKPNPQQGPLTVSDCSPQPANERAQIHNPNERQANAPRRVDEMPKPLTTTGFDGATEYNPANSYFVSASQAFFDGLPGLSPVAASRTFKPNLPPFQINLAEEAQETPQTTHYVPSVDSTDKMAATITPEQAPPEPISKDEMTVPIHSISNSEGAKTPPKVVPQIRKRATASDFIDSSPPPQPKRRVSSNGPIQLVIEVSEDEEEGANYSALSNIMELTASEMHAQTELRGGGSTKTLRNLPPLSAANFRIQPSSAVTTPPTTHTSRGLAQTEEEIRALNQRIAEMEQRKKTKKPMEMQPSTTTTDSTGLDNLTTESKAIESKKDQLDLVNKKLVEQQNSLAAAKSLIQEKLKTEKRIQALIVARAESEHRGAAQASSLPEQQKRLERKAALEAALPELDSQIVSAQTRMDSIRKLQEEVQVELEKGINARKNLVDELNALLSVDIRDGDVDPEAADVAMNATGLPDAARVARESSLAKSIERHPASLSPDLQDGANDSKFPASQEMMDDRSLVENNETMLEEKMDISSSSSDEGRISLGGGGSLPDRSLRRESSQAEDGELYETDVPRDERSNSGYYPPVESKDPDEPEHAFAQSRQASARADDTDLYESNAPEDNGSNGSFGPPFDSIHLDVPKERFDQSSMSTNQDYQFDNQEDYEPRIEQDALQKPANQPISISSSKSGISTPSQISSRSYEMEQYQGNVMDDDVDATHQDDLLASGEEIGDTVNARGESDDYEPPEPSLSVDNPVSRDSSNAMYSNSSPNPAQNGIEAMLEPQNSAVAVDSVTGSQPANTETTYNDEELEASAYAHFTPYESPLKQFKSYRFHPQYVPEVSGGFRSLTYSHNIEPYNTLCRWELADGVCSDASCEYQHFRDLPLSDNKLLVQLGSVHEGNSVEERQEYVNGLKQIISGMRDRNLNDVEAVAAEIVDYRTNFLKDRSRVLVNI